MNYRVVVDGVEHDVSVRRTASGWDVQVGDGPVESISGERVGNAEWVLDLGGRRRSIGGFVDGDRATVQVGGFAIDAEVVDPRDFALAGGSGASEGRVSTPMPGVIARVLVAEGVAVSAGQVLLVVEAMKMENELKSPMAGTIRRIAVAEGDLVEARAVLVELDDAEELAQVAETLRQAIAERTAATVSIGGAMAGGQASLDALVDSADQALYRAKGGGRDGIEGAA